MTGRCPSWRSPALSGWEPEHCPISLRLSQSLEEALLLPLPRLAASPLGAELHLPFGNLGHPSNPIVLISDFRSKINTSSI